MSTHLHLIEPLQSRFQAIIRDTRAIGWGLREGRMPATRLANRATELCIQLADLPLPVDTAGDATVEQHLLTPEPSDAIII
jgi:hypothetical protein